jgi:hypothetical protein
MTVENEKRETVTLLLGITVIVLVVALIFGVYLYSIERAPKLVKVYLEEVDVRPLFSDPYVQVNSVVINTGSLAAYDCKLHVVLYQGNVVSKEAYILLGDNGMISGKNWTIVDEKVYYDGGALARISVTPEWSPHS